MNSSNAHPRPVKRNAIIDDDDSSDEEIVRPPRKRAKTSKPDVVDIDVPKPEKSVPDSVSTKAKGEKKTKEKPSKSKQKESNNLENKKSEKKKKSRKKGMAESVKNSVSPMKKAQEDVTQSLPAPVAAPKVHQSSPFKADSQETSVSGKAHKDSDKRKNVGKESLNKPVKHSLQQTSDIEKPSQKKSKKSLKSDSVLSVENKKEGKAKKEALSKPIKPVTKSKTGPPPAPPPAMDWFSAQLASEVKKKQVSRKLPTKSTPGTFNDHGRAKDGGSSSSSLSQNKDVVLAAKFPHKRKLVSASEVLSSSHPKRTPTSSASASRTHRKAFT